MKIIIIGAGRIGSNLAKSLSDEDHEVFLVESNDAVAKKADEQLDVKVIQGSGTDPVVLRQAGIEKADLVLAVTLSDETNLVCCSLAASFGTKKRIARVRNTSLSREISQRGLESFYVHEIINPEEVAASAIVKAIEAPGTCEIGDFADGNILLRAFDVPEHSPLKSMAIMDFKDENFPWPFLIVAIRRQDEVIIPQGNVTIEAEDRFYVLLPKQSLGEFLSLVDPQITKAKKVIVYGATTTGEHVLKELSGKMKYLLMLEENLHKAQAIAGTLKEVRVIQGSGSEKDVLKESGVEVADVFVAASESDHSNLISAVLAKKMGAKYTIITTHHPDYMSIVDALDIDVVISPHLLAVDHILSYVRGENVNAVTKLVDCDAEAVEFIAEEGSPITRAALKDIAFPKNTIIGAVCRNSHGILAKGDTQIMPGEKVIAFCREHIMRKLQPFFTAPKKS